MQKVIPKLEPSAKEKQEQIYQYIITKIACRNQKRMWIGFFCGLLLDIFFGSVIGFYALVYAYIGYINGLFRKSFFPDDIKLPLFLISASDFCYNILVYLFLFFLRGILISFALSFYPVLPVLPANGGNLPQASMSLNKSDCWNPA